MRLCHFVGALIVLLASSLTASAAVQRMGIAAGVYDLAAGVSQNIAAFCFDLTRDSPSAATDFSHVLTSPDDVVVTVGHQHMSLQQAIDQHLVAVHGTQSSFAEMIEHARDPAFLSHLAKDERAQLQQVIAAWDAASDDEKTALEQQLAPQFARDGDHTRLSFENLTKQPISINVKSNALLGQEKEAAADVDVGKLDLSGTHDEVQHAVWKFSTKKHQQLLIDAGYYDGEASGELDEDTRLAIAELQAARGLPITGQIDAATETELKRAAADQIALKGLNEANGKLFLAGTVEAIPDGPNKRVYRLAFGDGLVIHGESIKEVYAELNKLSQASGAERVYLVPGNLSGNRTKGLVATVQNVVRQDPTGVDVKIVDPSEGGIANHEFFGRPIKAVVDDGQSPRQITLGSQPAYQKALQVLYEDGSRQSIGVIAATREMLSDFIANLFAILKVLRSAEAPAGGDHLTAIEVVNQAYLQTRLKHNLSAAEMRKRMKVQFGNVEIAEIERLRRVALADLLPGYGPANQR